MSGTIEIVLCQRKNGMKLQKKANPIKFLGGTGVGESIEKKIESDLCRGLGRVHHKKMVNKFWAEGEFADEPDERYS